MKFLLLLAALSTAFASWGQGSQGGQLVGGNTRYDFTQTILLFRQDTTVVTGTQVDSLGHFHVANLPVGRYTVEVKSLGYRTQILDPVVIGTGSNPPLTIAFPGPCPYQYPAGQRPRCGQGHSHQLLPIVYGLPTARTMARAKRGKVYLAGCEVTDCDPRYYCPLHQTKF